MFRVEVSGHSLLVHRGPMPEMYASYRQHAALADEFDLKAFTGGGPAVQPVRRWI
jgi:hypothetical protein